MDLCSIIVLSFVIVVYRKQRYGMIQNDGMVWYLIVVLAYINTKWPPALWMWMSWWLYDHRRQHHHRHHVNVTSASASASSLPIDTVASVGVCVADMGFTGKRSRRTVSCMSTWRLSFGIRLCLCVCVVCVAIIIIVACGKRGHSH